MKFSLTTSALYSGVRIPRKYRPKDYNYSKLKRKLKALAILSFDKLEILVIMPSSAGKF